MAERTRLTEFFMANKLLYAYARVVLVRKNASEKAKA